MGSSWTILQIASSPTPWVVGWAPLQICYKDTLILSILYILCTYMYIYMGLGKAGFNLGVLVTEGGPTQPTGDEHGPNLKEI